MSAQFWCYKYDFLDFVQNVVERRKYGPVKLPSVEPKMLIAK